MKSILQNIFEASGKPSDLKKYKRQERKEMVHFKSGDMFDLSDPGYDEEFSYFDGSGNGYIKDKEGHVYDVVARDSQGDAGAIAGGSHDYYVTIKKANGKDDFSVHGWIGIMSSGSNTGCIADIKAGHYLEDYVAKYYSSVWHGEKFKELAEKGDKNAKSFETEKAEKIQQKKDDFDTRYVIVPENISWNIKEGKFNFERWTLEPKSAEKLKKDRDAYMKKNFPGKYSWDDEVKNDPEYKKFVETLEKNQKEFRTLIEGILRPVLEGRLSKVFKTKDFSKLAGIAGSFGYEKKVAGGKNFGYKCLAIDTKKKEFVVIDSGDRKVIEGKIELQLNDNITVWKDQASEEMIKLFKKVSDAWKKAEGRKQTEYVGNNWERIQKESGGYWKYNKSKSQAIADAKAEFQQICRDHDFTNTSKNRFVYSLALVQVYVEGDMEPDAKPVEKPLENPEPEGGNSSDEGGKEEKKERGKDTKMSKGANKAAYDKMKQWHEGTRKQNLSNCSDAKLKMNYKVCKELGYEKEMELLKKEAEKRNINIEEKLSLKELVLTDSEFDNDNEG